ncbi:MAG: Holliday junction branch migration protein RuvA [Clostridia bacterium]|nr:Holliday junction branch migration protein RuvA [Clostridia bacterium]MBQ1943002.1 Holliday junction branch migration protein RuvA [Clostridia bacterium]
MIGYIEGKVMAGDGITVLLMVNGIGYEVACSGAAYAMLMNAGEGGVYTYLQVKEDGISLYGFISPEEKNLFIKLISVSGVGPKMAILVLSQMDAAELANAIVTEDIKRLCLVKGLGKKTAERIILDLKESLTSLDIPLSPKKKAKPTANEDALLALSTLGFSRQESQKAVEEAESLGLTSVEQILSYAIKHIR